MSQVVWAILGLMSRVRQVLVNKVGNSWFFGAILLRTVPFTFHLSSINVSFVLLYSAMVFTFLALFINLHLLEWRLTSLN